MTLFAIHQTVILKLEINEASTFPVYPVAEG